MNEIAKRIISELISRDGRSTFRIAFLPYKYSMWDSMQSVYEEAQNAGLYARIYPIPYFTKADGQVHDESRYFKLSRLFDNWDMESFKPDYVVIHNPYDDHNRITEVYPYYNSKNLKERGYQLIYIPYSSMMKYQNFVAQTGVINSDYIVVQDQEEANLYRDVWLRKVNLDISDRLIIAGGHPKQDIAQRTPEEIILPKEWLEHGIFKRPIVAVFGGLTSLLADPTNILQIYRDIIFGEMLNDVCVIFRPHPLTADGFKSMLPDAVFLWDTFLDDIKDKCIVDNSPYLYRAIYICERAYADRGSVQDLLRWAGKEYIEIKG